MEGVIRCKGDSGISEWDTYVECEFEYFDRLLEIFGLVSD